MKRLAIFLEGKTEQIFIDKFLREFISMQNLAIETVEASGTECPRFTTIISSDNLTNQTKYEVLLFNSCSDRRVISDLVERYENLKNEGYNSFLAIRDLYPEYTYDERDEAKEDSHFFIRDFENTTIIYATMEVETWFIAELNHYPKIDTRLTVENIKNNLINLESMDNFEKDMVEPSKQLNKIYNLVDKHWSKSEKGIVRTVNNLDYENLYYNTREQMPSLNQLITKLDEFFID
ncbi:MAG: hypothetical protein DRG30_02070 [Epsilonproteobacteria bacterium]|nr:MAG: hypothetical protein DRG30_02070 [Campylobacterota bacterium]